MGIVNSIFMNVGTSLFLRFDKRRLLNAINSIYSRLSQEISMYNREPSTSLDRCYRKQALS